MINDMAITAEAASEKAELARREARESEQDFIAHLTQQLASDAHIKALVTDAPEYMLQRMETAAEWIRGRVHDAVRIEVERRGQTISLRSD